MLHTEGHISHFTLKHPPNGIRTQMLQDVPKCWDITSYKLGTNGQPEEHKPTPQKEDPVLWVACDTKNQGKIKEWKEWNQKTAHQWHGSFHPRQTNRSHSRESSHATTNTSIAKYYIRDRRDLPTLSVSYPRAKASVIEKTENSGETQPLIFLRQNAIISFQYFLLDYKGDWEIHHTQLGIPLYIYRFSCSGSKVPSLYRLIVLLPSWDLFTLFLFLHEICLLHEYTCKCFFLSSP